MRLGQHFLISQKYLRKIAEGLDLKPNDVVIEIGPGHGELTKELKVQNLKLKVVAIEKDERLVELLKEKFASDKNIEIIEGDALEILPKLTNNKQLTANNYKLAGNIPYYITGHLLRILSELENKPSLIVLTIQKEVAERICAKPLHLRQGSRLRSASDGQASGQAKMSLLAASVQFWAEPKIIGNISKKYFRPMPKVDSAIVALRPLTNADLTQTNAEKYYQFIKILFKQPRKTILNNIVSEIKNREQRIKDKPKIIKKLEKLGINPALRPQNLNLEQIKECAAEFKK